MGGGEVLWLASLWPRGYGGVEKGVYVGYNAVSLGVECADKAGSELA